MDCDIILVLYTITNICVVRLHCLHRNCRKPFVQMLYPELYRPIGLKFYMRHPGVGLYQNYGNYADSAVLCLLL